jgi:uncharacterized protein YecE (DUF72 family)
VEVNSSYYRTPQPATSKQWIAETPPGFLFDVKLHRAFSRSPGKVAKDGKLLSYLLKGVAPLIKAKRLGAFLLVLAPDFGPEKHSIEEIDELAKKLAPHPLAVELRHRAWVQGKARAATLAYFRKRGITWVAVDMPRIADSTIMPVVDEVTQPRLAYLRLHGRNPGWLEADSAAARHAYFYSEAELKELAARIKRLAGKAERVRVVANNHHRDFAPKTVLALRALLKLPGKSALHV